MRKIALLWATSVAIATLFVAPRSPAFDIRGRPCDIGGTVIDHAGIPLSGVRLDITITELVNLEPVRTATNEIIDASFRLKYPIVAELSVAASKDGYSTSDAYFSRQQLDAKDVVLQLFPTPVPTSLVQVDLAKVSIQSEGIGTGIVVSTGAMVALTNAPDITIAFPENWSPTNESQLGVARICMAGNGGFAPIVTNRRPYISYSLADGFEAPESGYVHEIQVPLSGEYSRFYYFRTPAGLYGKLSLDSIHYWPEYKEVAARMTYFYQPDGGRNLNNGKRLKLIRAMTVK